MPQSKHRRGGSSRPRGPRAQPKSKPGRDVRTAPAISREATATSTKRRWDRGKVAWVLIALASVIFVQHFVSHTGLFTVFSSGWDDLLIGYPTAAILAFSGIMMMSRPSAKKNRR